MFGSSPGSKQNLLPELAFLSTPASVLSLIFSVHCSCPSQKGCDQKHGPASLHANPRPGCAIAQAHWPSAPCCNEIMHVSFSMALLHLSCVTHQHTSIQERPMIGTQGGEGWVPPEAAAAAVHQASQFSSWACPACTLINAPQVLPHSCLLCALSVCCRHLYASRLICGRNAEIKPTKGCYCCLCCICWSPSAGVPVLSPMPQVLRQMFESEGMQLRQQWSNYVLHVEACCMFQLIAAGSRQHQLIALAACC